ncbi:UNVERIFIED_ORG: PRTRC genetic system protein B [Burkholderia sp. 1263]
MNDVVIHHRGNIDLELDAALLFYRSKIGDIYATQHTARVVDDRPVLLPGTPMTLEGLADFVELAAKRTSYRGFVHDRVVYLAPNTLAWWLPAGTRRVWFKTTSKLADRSGECNHPPLLFIVNRRSWSVFALRHNERPGAGSRLYQAPYFNVWDDGRICVGNADTPKTISSDSIKPYEDAFFRSRFTHANTPRLIRRRGGAVRLWLDLLDGAEFPLHQLIDTKRTLADVINNLTDKD